jgi:hypothetical protein
MNAFSELFSDFHRMHSVRTKPIDAWDLDMKEREGRKEAYRVNDIKKSPTIPAQIPHNSQTNQKNNRGIVNHRVNMNLNIDPSSKNIIKVRPPQGDPNYLALSELTDKLDYDALNAVKEIGGLPQYNLRDDPNKYSLGSKHSVFNDNNSLNVVQVNFNLDGNFAPQVAPSRSKGIHRNETSKPTRNAWDLPTAEQNTLAAPQKTNPWVIQESQRSLARSENNMDDIKSDVSQRNVSDASRSLAGLMVPNQGRHGQISRGQMSTSEPGISQADGDFAIRMSSKKQIHVKFSGTGGGKKKK